MNDDLRHNVEKLIIINFNLKFLNVQNLFKDFYNKMKFSNARSFELNLII